MPVAMACRTLRSPRCSFLKLKSKCSNVGPEVDLAGHVRKGLDLLDLVELRLRVDQVNLVVLQRRRLGGRLGQEPDHHRVQVGLRPEVLVVADHGQALARGVVVDLEPAAGGDLLGVLVQAVVPAARLLLHVVGGQDEVPRREQRLPVAERGLEDHRDRLAVVGALDALDLVVAGGAGDVVVLDGAVEVLPQVDEVVGRDRGAVRPGGVLLDLVDDRLRVLAGLLGRVEEVLVHHDLEVGGEVEGHRHRVHHDVRHRGPVVLGGVVVEAGGLLVGGVVQGAALLDLAAAATAGPPAVVAAAAAGRGDHGEPDEQGGQPGRTQTMHLSRTSCSESWPAAHRGRGPWNRARHRDRGPLPRCTEPLRGAPPTCRPRGLSRDAEDRQAILRPNRTLSARDPS